MESAENREQTTSGNPPTQEPSDSSSLSKVETLKLLNDSIDQLEETIKGISENSASDLPSSDSINDLLATTQELADTVASKPTEPIEVKPVNSINEPVSEKPTNKISSNVSHLPTMEMDEAKANKISATKQKPKQNKAVLISIGVFAIAMAVVAVFWIWFPKYQASLNSVAQAPALETIVERKTTTVTETINSSPSQSMKQSQTDDLTPANIPDMESTLANSESADEIVIPQDLIAPGRAKNLKIVTIEPELTFTPEQNFIAVLQTKIANITEGYATDFIHLIKVNLGENSILVEVNDSWYELNQSRQNKVSNAILERSRQLKFNQLKFQDSGGTLVARSPVVGQNMIILTNLRKNN